MIGLMKIFRSIKIIMMDKNPITKKIIDNLFFFIHFFIIAFSILIHALFVVWNDNLLDIDVLFLKWGFIDIEKFF